MAGIFISYRRDDSAGWAGRLATDLIEKFGRDAVFQDISAISAGEDFINVIERMLGDCSAVLVLIGPDWSGVKGENGNRRLDDPSDTVRLEIAKALKREGVLVVPVLLGGASMPDAKDLPDELELLARRNAFELSDKRWDYDLDQLAETLIKSAGHVPIAKPEHAPKTQPRKRWLFAIVVCVLAVFSSLIGYKLYEQSGPGNSFEVFAIDSPATDQEIPLGEQQTRIVEGRLQVAGKVRSGTAKPEIDVQVFKLPDGIPVGPQQGTVLYSSEQGRWEYIAARFDGKGRYKITATVSFGGNTDFYSVNVNCLAKGEAFKQAITKDREVRGVGTLNTVVLDETQLRQLKSELNRLNREFFNLFPGDLDAAEANARQTLDRLEPVLPSHPNDWALQNLNAFTLKNYALVMRNRGKTEEFHRYLKKAQLMFETIREQKPNDAGAWNGLGSVALLQNEPERALVYIDRALKLNPNYEAALHDRKLAVRMIEQKRKRD